NIYRSWRKGEGYKDIPGFCKSATLEEVKKNNYVLTPGRYVGMTEEEAEDEPFEEKMKKLTQQLAEQFRKNEELKEKIKKSLGALGYEF
ncbi:MAG: SAM-dependent methyltransferase, partial [Ignavibacteria bacterium]|nr:SAM-dependent methyltransferase [Ignavibacteria bacterium]